MEDKIFDQEFFKKLSTINYLIRMKLSQGASGGRKSSAKGTSVEFSDFREYVQGDDFRRIDWNAYGRFEKLFVKLFMEEREAVFNIYVDGSTSMSLGDKSKMALKISAALSYIVLNNLDKVYIHTLKNKQIMSTKPMTGKVAFQKLLKELSMIQFDSQTELSSAIRSRDLKNRGVSIILSDFFCKEPLDDLLKYLAYKKQEVLLIHILSPEEVNPDFEKVVNLVDSETNEKMKVSLSPSIKKAYLKTLEDFKLKIEEKASKYGATYVNVLSNEPLDQVILKSFTSKGFLRKV
jgi:uncharacterized protein (DUF58 family)